MPFSNNLARQVNMNLNSLLNDYLKLVLSLGFVISSLVVTPSSLAQEEEIARYYENWYEIEVIVFENKSHIPNNDPEAWPKNLVLAYPPNLQFVIDPEELQLFNAEREAEKKLNNDEIFQSKPDEVTTDDTNLNPSNEDISANEQSSIEIGYDLEEPFFMLDESLLKMKNEENSLRTSRMYRKLFHQAWRQPVSEKKDASSIVIIAGNQYDKNNELEGTIEISLSRYLHLNTNLWFTSFEPNFGQAANHWPELPEQPKNPLFSDLKTEEGNYLSAFTDKKTETWEIHQPDENNKFAIKDLSLNIENSELEGISEQNYLTKQIVKLSAKRRMRSGELHYIDHPKIGILIKIEKYIPEILDNMNDGQEI